MNELLLAIGILCFFAFFLMLAICNGNKLKIENKGGIFCPKAENPHEISGPRKFSILAVQMQRAHGWHWHEIALDWIYAWFFVPVMVLFSWYPNGPVTRFMFKGLHRCHNPYNWWSLAPNWCAKWSARKAWGKNYKTPIATAAIAFLLLLALPAGAQTNQLPSLMGNLPPFQTNTTLFTSGKLEFRAAVTTGASYQAVNSLSWFITQGFALTGDCANGGVNNLDAFHFGGEYAYPVGGLRFTGRAVGGLSLLTHRPEGQISGFISYVPINAAANLFLFVGPSVTLYRSSFQRNGVITVNAFGGVGYRF